MARAEDVGDMIVDRLAELVAAGAVAGRTSARDQGRGDIELCVAMLNALAAYIRATSPSHSPASESHGADRPG
jgi:hypothetical protein